MRGHAVQHLLQCAGIASMLRLFLYCAHDAVVMLLQFCCGSVQTKGLQCSVAQYPSCCAFWIKNEGMRANSQWREVHPGLAVLQQYSRAGLSHLKLIKLVIPHFCCYKVDTSVPKAVSFFNLQHIWWRHRHCHLFCCRCCLHCTVLSASHQTSATLFPHQSSYVCTSCGIEYQPK